MSTWRELKNNDRLKRVYQRRLDIIRHIRDFFESKDFLEVDTPIALRLAGQETNLTPVPVDFHHPDGRVRKFYLQTSPEYGMKKLLAVGFERIWQMCKSFRDQEDWGGLHNPEFTMIEWYRLEADLDEIMSDCENLFRFVAQKIDQNIIEYRERQIDLSKPWAKMSMKELWAKYAKADLDQMLDKNNLAEFVHAQGYSVSPTDSYEELFFTIFLNLIEPRLVELGAVFVYDYPAQMCSLSRLCLDDARYAQRFELYIGGLEIANAFGELTDKTEQKKRLVKDRLKRQSDGRTVYDLDEDFIEALGEIKSAPAGIALGVDRMVLLLSGAKNINEVIFQSVANQLEL